MSRLGSTPDIGDDIGDDLGTRLKVILYPFVSDSQDYVRETKDYPFTIPVKILIHLQSQTKGLSFNI